MKKVIVVLISLLLVIMLAACGANNSSSSPSTPSQTAPGSSPSDTPSTGDGTDTLKIGLLLNTTGWFSSVDISNRDETMAAAAVINEKGGWDIGGKKYKIELVVSDMQSDPAQARAAGLNLIDQGIDYIMETVDFMVVGNQDLYVENGVMAISSFAPGLPGYSGPNTNTFLATGGGWVGCDAAVRVVSQVYPDVKTIVYADSEAGEVNDFNNDVTGKAAAAEGLEFMADKKVIFPQDATDFAAIATRLIATGADAVVIGSTIANQAAILKELRNQGSDMILASVGPHAGFIMQQLAGKDAAYNATTLGYLPGYEGNGQWFEDIYAKYAELNGPEVAKTFNSGWPSGLFALLQVMSAAGTTDVQTVMNTWVSLDSIQTIYGKDAKFGGTKLFDTPNRVILQPAGMTVLTKDGIEFKGFIDTHLD